MYVFLVGTLLVFLQVQPVHAAPGADDPEPLRPTAAASVEKLTAEDHKTFTATGRLSVVQQANGIYVPGPIKYPCGQTWSSWWAANYWYFQCLANMNCRPYTGCWCNSCACYFFIVNPQYPPCRRWIPWDSTVSAVKTDVYEFSEVEGGK